MLCAALAGAGLGIGPSADRAADRGRPGGPGGGRAAPWFFLWVQQMLRFENPFIWEVACTTSIVLLCAGLASPLALPSPSHASWVAGFPTGNRLASVFFNSSCCWICRSWSGTCWRCDESANRCGIGPVLWTLLLLAWLVEAARRRQSRWLHQP